MAVRVVLVEPSHPGNIGAVARAMGNMGFSDLALVRPVSYLVEEARVRTAGNEQILASASCFETLTEAIAKCHLVVGTSARLRTVDWPSLPPKESMRRVADNLRQGGNAAIVFGPERTGLSNQDTDRCDLLVRIPVDNRAPSINLAGAVIVILYELRLALQSGEYQPGSSDEKMATQEQIEGMFAHLNKVLEEIDFITGGPREILKRKIRRIFLRPSLTEDEVNILRGILTAISKKASCEPYES